MALTLKKQAEWSPSDINALPCRMSLGLHWAYEAIVVPLFVSSLKQWNLIHSSLVQKTLPHQW
jgi:hypothetical protein